MGYKKIILTLGVLTMGLYTVRNVIGNKNVTDKNKIKSKTEISDTKETVRNTERTEERIYLTADSTIRALLEYKRIKRFSRFILPLEWGYSENTKLGEIDYLLPYHSNIKPETTIKAINYIIGETEKGNEIFFDIYTEDEKKQDRTKENTGLFFFRGKENAPFAVINAGGGFSYVGSIHEGFPYAMEINRMGYNAFVLQYRIGDSRKAVEDLIRAIDFIFKNSRELKVDSKNYSIWGSSAGARMAYAAGIEDGRHFGNTRIEKPSMIVVMYTGQSYFSHNDPPTFIGVGENDRIASPQVVEKRAEDMRKAGVKVKFYKYRNVGHGFGLGIGTSAEGWTKEAVKFWEEQMR